MQRHNKDKFIAVWEWKEKLCSFHKKLNFFFVNMIVVILLQICYYGGSEFEGRKSKPSEKGCRFGKDSTLKIGGIS